MVKFQILHLQLVLTVLKDYEIYQKDLKASFLGQELGSDEN